VGYDYRAQWDEIVTAARTDVEAAAVAAAIRNANDTGHEQDFTREALAWYQHAVWTYESTLEELTSANARTTVCPHGTYHCIRLGLTDTFRHQDCAYVVDRAQVATQRSSR
jgi:hypothetical protein